MKFQVTILFLIIASISGFLLDSDVSTVKTDLQTAKDLLKFKILNKEDSDIYLFHSSDDNCMFNFLNITSDGSEDQNSNKNLLLKEKLENFDKRGNLDFAYELATIKCINNVDLNNFGIENAESLRINDGEDLKEIQCKKLFLSKVKPNSEMLQGFDPKYAEFFRCEDNFFLKENLKKYFSQNIFKKLTLEKANEIMRKVTAETFEFHLMAASGKDVISDEKLIVKAKEVYKYFFNAMEYLLSDIMSDFEE